MANGVKIYRFRPQASCPVATVNASDSAAWYIFKCLHFFIFLLVRQADDSFCFSPEMRNKTSRIVHTFNIHFHIEDFAIDSKMPLERFRIDGKKQKKDLAIHRTPFVISFSQVSYYFHIKK